MGEILAPFGAASRLPHMPLLSRPSSGARSVRATLAPGPPLGARQWRPIPDLCRVPASPRFRSAPLQPSQCVPQASCQLQRPARPLFDRIWRPSHGPSLGVLDGRSWAAGHPLHTLRTHHPRGLPPGFSG
ncbi:hypothetical protein NDU88_007600 [Pleurodeles waltl]|uniref:Uncharacterized protein n=1 Tax=Pleurodeles waltl TaxID=8319 RepID=A0AAV7N5U5_PLEWA|nr:hypothetical protein NDU88_007600 [Pleurodeles waltl]